MPILKAAGAAFVLVGMVRGEPRGKYYRLLLAVSQKGEWGAWIEFFLAGVVSQGQDAVKRSEQLMKLWQDY